jgi:SAM-dependent methyltransferase
VSGGAAPDGSPVALYLRLGPEPELSVLMGLLPPGASVLDLGCGTGRIADALAERGHPVVGVDESPAMLAHVRLAQAVHAPIEGLDLGRRFDAVLLLSHLVNTADDGQRAAFLATCARHAGGVVVLQRHPPGWHAQWPGLEDVSVAGDEVTATSVYRLPEGELRQRWRARVLDDDALDDQLRAAGLRRVPGPVDDRWVIATPTL